MSQKNNVENKTAIEDLPVDDTQAKDVKGGPIYMKYDGIDGDVTAAGHERWMER